MISGSPPGLAWSRKISSERCLKGVLWTSHRAGYRHYVAAPAGKLTDAGVCEAGYHCDATVRFLLCNGSTICEDCIDAMGGD